MAKELLSAIANLEKEDAEAAIEDATKAVGSLKGTKDKDEFLEALRCLINAQALKAEKSGTKATEAESTAEKELDTFKSSSDEKGEAAMLLSLADVNCNGQGTKGRTQAEEWATAALSVFNKSGDKKFELAALNRLASIHIKEQEPEEALRVSTEAAALAKDLGNKKEEAMALHSMGWAHMLLKASDIALDKAEEALVLWKDLGLENKQAMELCAIAKVFMQQGKPQAALVRAQEALGISATSDAAFLVVGAHLKKNQPGEAVKAAKEGLSLVRKKNNQKEEAAALQIVAKAQLAAGSEQDASKSLDEAVAIARSSGDKQHELTLLHALADTFSQRKQFDKAVSTLQEAIASAEESDSTSQRGLCLCALASAYRDMGKYDKALEVAAEAQEVNQEVGDRSGMGVALSVISSVHSANEDYNKALKAAGEAHELFFVCGDLQRDANLLPTIAELNVAVQKNDDAAKALMRAIGIWQELGNAKGQSGAIRALANLYLRLSMGQHAEATAREAQRISKEAGDEEGEAAALIVLAECYALGFAGDNKAGDAFLQSGNLQQLASVTSEAVSVATTAGNTFIQAVACHWRAQYLMWSAKPPPVDEAMTLAEKAQGLFQKSKDSDWEAQSLVLIGYLHLAGGRRQLAISSVQQAVSISSDDAATAKVATDAMDFIENYVDASAGPVRPGGRGGRPGAGGPPSSVAAGGAVAKAGLDPSMVKSKLSQLVNDVIATGEDVAMDSSLMDSGLDSLAATDLTSQVAREFQLGVTPSLVFDFPTIREMVSHLVEESQS